MTLAELIDEVRSRLDDTDSQQYAWTTDDLLDYVNQIIDIFCEEAYIVEDASTAAICQIAVTGGVSPVTTYSLDPRIVGIRRAKLSLESTPITAFHDVEYMDVAHPNWESAEQATPYIIINEGVGTDSIRLFPPPLVNDTLNLTVFRRLLSPLTAANIAQEIPISTRLHRLLISGICWKAYEKNDEETEAQKKAEKYKLEHKEDLDLAKRRHERRFYQHRTIIPLLANR